MDDMLDSTTDRLFAQIYNQCGPEASKHITPPKAFDIRSSQVRYPQGKYLMVRDQVAAT